MKLKPLGHIATAATEGKIYSCTSVWPPGQRATAILTDKDLTVIYRDWFKQRDVRTVHLEDLSSVEAITGPFLGHVKILSKYMTTEGWTVSWLTKRDAYKLRDLTNELKKEASKPKDESGGQ